MTGGVPQERKINNIAKKMIKAFNRILNLIRRVDLFTTDLSHFERPSNEANSFLHNKTLYLNGPLYGSRSQILF